MCISAVSNNFYPFNRKPVSIVATSLVVATVIAGVMLGVSCGLKWGVGAIATCSSVAGVALLVTLAILLCKQCRCARPTMRERLPYPSQRLPEVFPGVNEPDMKVGRASVIEQQLYALIKKEDAANFERALKLYDAKDVQSMSLCSGRLMDDDDPLLAEDEKNHGHTLFHRILKIKDLAVKNQFLLSLFTSLPDHCIDDQHDSIFEQYLAIQNTPLMAVLYSKLRDRTVCDFIKYLLKQEKGEEFVGFVKHYIYDPWMQKAQSQHWLVYDMLQSKLPFIYKMDSLRSLSGSGGLAQWSLELKGFSLHPKGAGMTGSAPLLHLAIASKEHELVKELLSRQGPDLANKPFISTEKDNHYTLPPLMLAVLNNDTACVKALLKAQADPHFILKSKHVTWITHQSRRAATQITPLMMAARLGNQDVVDALLAAGARPDIKDGEDKDAWTMKEYASEYKKYGN